MEYGSLSAITRKKRSTKAFRLWEGNESGQVWKRDSSYLRHIQNHFQTHCFDLCGSRLAQSHGHHWKTEDYTERFGYTWKKSANFLNTVKLLDDYQVPDLSFNHMELVMGKRVGVQVNSKILEILARYWTQLLFHDLLILNTYKNKTLNLWISSQRWRQLIELFRNEKGWSLQSSELSVSNDGKLVNRSISRIIFSSQVS